MENPGWGKSVVNYKSKIQMKPSFIIATFLMALTASPVAAQMNDLRWNLAANFEATRRAREGAPFQIEGSLAGGYVLNRQLMVGTRFFYGRTSAASLDTSFGPFHYFAPGLFVRGFVKHEDWNIPIYPYLDVFLGSFSWNGNERAGQVNVYHAIQNRTAIGLSYWPVKRVSLDAEVRFVTRPKSRADDLSNLDFRYNGELGLYWTLGIWLGKKSQKQKN